MKDHLRSRCGGLLEVRRAEEHPAAVTPPEGRIVLLNKTISEFRKNLMIRARIEFENRDGGSSVQP